MYFHIFLTTGRCPIAPTPPLFDRITIIGLGLIGGSVARAARENRLAGRIVGCDISDVALAYASSHGMIDEASIEPRKACAGSSVVILAVPPSALEGVARAIGPLLAPGTLVMDTASVKRAAMEAVAPHMPPHVDFIPAHPIAGSEQTGVAAGRADMFYRKRVIVTPPSAVQTAPLQKATAFWSGMGARVEAMPAELHDTVYAYVSHLPQLLSFAAGEVIGRHDAALTETMDLEKFLRLSHSDPGLWSEIMISNRDNILKALDRYLDVVSHIKSELSQPPSPQDNTDGTLAYTLLFPRIAASCLITTVMEMERQAGLPFARYAGTGFADFTSPAAAPPEGDIERISSHCLAVVGVLEEFARTLRSLCAVLSTGDDAQMKTALHG